MESLHRRENTLFSARVAAHCCKHRRGRLRPARQKLGVVSGLALKKLAGQPKRKRPVQRGAPGAQNVKPFSLPHLLSGPEKLGFAETGLGLDEKQATLTPAYARDLRRYQLQLAFTLQNAGTAACPNRIHQVQPAIKVTRRPGPRSA